MNSKTVVIDGFSVIKVADRHWSYQGIAIRYAKDMGSMQMRYIVRTPEQFAVPNRVRTLTFCSFYEAAAHIDANGWEAK